MVNTRGCASRELPDGVSLQDCGRPPPLSPSLSLSPGVRWLHSFRAYCSASTDASVPNVISSSLPPGSHQRMLSPFTTCSPTATATLDGVIYRTMEDSSVGVGALVMWATTSDNLLDPHSWQHSEPLAAPPTPKDSRRHDWQEGNAVVAPSGLRPELCCMWLRTVHV